MFEWAVFCITVIFPLEKILNYKKSAIGMSQTSINVYLRTPLVTVPKDEKSTFLQKCLMTKMTVRLSRDKSHLCDGRTRVYTTVKVYHDCSDYLHTDRADSAESVMCCIYKDGCSC